MKILQWNIKGYINNFLGLQLLINNFNPDIICLQETHFSHTQNNTVLPKGYTGYFANLPTIISSKQGIAILIKNYIPHKKTHITSSIVSIGIEIAIDFSFTIINTYIPPHQNFSTNELATITRNATPPIILTGDLNAWSPLWGSKKSNERGILIEDFIICEDLVVLNDGSATHFSTHQSFTHVDLTICSSMLAPKCTWQILDNLHGSDHFPIVTSMQSTLVYELIRPKLKFKTDVANWPLYQNLCTHFSSQSNHSHNINKEAAKLNKIIRSAGNMSIPQSKPFRAKSVIPWWNSNIEKLRQEKQTLWKNFRRSRSEENLILYKKAKSNFKKAVKDAKNLSLENLTSKINPNSPIKKIWNDIKILTGNRTNTSIKLLNTGSKIITSASEIANFFGTNWSLCSEDKHFHAEFIRQKNATLHNNYRPSSISNLAKKIETNITSVELEQALKRSKGQTPGFDRINYPMIANLPLTVKIRMIHLFNNIFDRGIYPQDWRTAVVVPIPKPNKPTSEISGYRPISLLSCVAKTFEKIIAKRIMWFVTRNNLISPNQTAFRGKQSTTDVLLHLQHYVSNALSCRNHVTILATDFERAFDRIGVHVVLQQPGAWGTGPKIFNVVKAFLTCRKFRVTINSQYSNTFPLHNGMPQGSPLSVILFIIAFEQLSKIISKYKKIEHSIYADDAILFTNITDMDIIKSLFTNILSDIKTWGNSSGANLSINKCKMLHICRKINCKKFKLYLDSINIEFVNYIKILGIIFEKNFSFKQQCIHLRNSLAARLNIVKFLSSKHSLIHVSTLINVTKALILSKIEYALPVYGWCAVSNLKLLYKPYHTAVRRSIHAFPTSPTFAILAEAGLPSILELVTKSTYKLIPKLYNAHNELLYKDVLSTIKSKKNYKVESTIRRCVRFAKTLKIILRPQLIKPENEPHWNLNQSSFILELEKFPKESTTCATFKQSFLNIIEPYRKKGWNFLYTDGSKTDYSTSFAVLRSSGTLITRGIIEQHCSIFTAEALALKLATDYAKKNKGKFVICSDSKSVINAIRNIGNANNMVSEIRTTCIKNSNKIRIMWVPGHKGLEGNELADHAADDTHLTPCFTFHTTSNNDILNAINRTLALDKQTKWLNYNNKYTLINKHGEKPIFPSTSTRQQTQTFIRLRIGHTHLTHEHLLQNSQRTTCPFCNSTLSTEHILNDCSQLNVFRLKFFGIISPSTLLTTINLENMSKFINYLKACNILHKI